VFFEIRLDPSGKTPACWHHAAIDLNDAAAGNVMSVTDIELRLAILRII
jgi:hypothetical protein